MSIAKPPIRTSSIYEENRAYVLAVLGRRCGWLDPSDREALLHDAFAVFLEKQHNGQLDVDAMSPSQVRAYLTQTALNKAMDEGKRAGRRRSVSLDDEDLGVEPMDPGRELPDRLADSFDEARIREIVAELPERQQVIVKLRFFLDRTPDEIQRHMGVTERVYRRELERATRHIAERVELVRNGQFCESRRSLILAYVTGVAGPSRIADARRHIASCPGCASWVREMRTTIDRAAAIVPMPLVGGFALEATPHHLVGSHRLLAGAHRLLSRISGSVSRARAHVADATVSLDPTKMTVLTGARPGAAAAVIVGCLAAGSGATYCVVAGVPAPIRSLMGIHDAARHRPRHVHHIAVGPPATTVTSATTSLAGLEPSHRRAAVVKASKRASSKMPKISKRAARAAQVHRATAPEYGVGNGSPLPASAPGTSQSTGASPPPAPSKHLPEFDP